MAQRESMDRRSFVKVAGAMLPGAALIGTLAAGASQAAAQDGAKGAAQEPKPAPAKPNWGDKPLRVGLIGCVGVFGAGGRMGSTEIGRASCRERV